MGLAKSVLEGLHREDRQSLTLTLKVKYHDFKSVTRIVTFAEPIGAIDLIMEKVKRLLENTEAGKKEGAAVGDICFQCSGEPISNKITGSKWKTNSGRNMHLSKMPIF